jgi:diguanylate cyclase (GGDEF)-like protein/PAS domain S-box-containing protein
VKTRGELENLTKDELIDLAQTYSNKLNAQKHEIDIQQYELRESQNLLSQYRRSVDESTILLICNQDGIITYANKAFCTATGYSLDKILNKSYSTLIATECQDELYNMNLSIKHQDVYKGVLKLITDSYKLIYLNITVVPFLDTNGEIKKYASMCYDVTEYYEQKKIIKRQYTDELTALYNRQKLINDIESFDEFISLAIINIDDFREFNDLYGHQFGDMILKSVALRIDNILKDKDTTLYKLPSDEYAVLFNATDTQMFEEEMKDLSYKISKNPLIVDNQELHLSVSIGIAHSKDNLLSKADIALSDAKKYKQEVLVYDVASEVEKKYENNIHWIKKLKDAIESDKIVTYYQPIYNNQTNKVEKYESLVRLIDENGKIITPYFFLEVSKKSRFYNKLTQIVIEQSFKKFANTDCEFSINFSIEDIQNSDTVDFLLKKIERFPDPERVIVEITESEGIQNYSQVAEFIKELHTYGSKVAIDDFGTGYSNFDRILKLNVDYIKIDGSLISDINKNESLKIICETIVMFAKRLGIKIVAEFVSDEGIQKQIQSMGIEYSQGYFIDAPKKDIDI